MERKIGEIFEYEGKYYRVVESKLNLCCHYCAFRKSCENKITKVTGSCIGSYRSDRKNVFFEEFKDTEIKDNELTINIPEGMEIDTENSDFKAGVIKFKKKELTYKEILDSVGKYPTSTFVTPRNRLKLNAIDILINIAKYYNGDWKPNWSDIKEAKYSILCWENDYYDIRCNYKACNNVILFKNKEDAQAVIDNPNFREILDATFKN